jgi:hypothetical protein
MVRSPLLGSETYKLLTHTKLPVMLCGLRLVVAIRSRSEVAVTQRTDDV